MTKNIIKSELIKKYYLKVVKKILFKKWMIYKH